MRTFILIIICSLFICSVAHAQGQTYMRWRDATNTDVVANVEAAGATFAATQVGGHTLSSSYVYDGAAWDAMTATAWGDALSETQQGVDTLAYLVGHDVSGAQGIRLSALNTFANGQATTLNGLWTGSVMFGYNGATFDMVKVSATDALMVNQENFPLAYDEGNAWVNSRKASIATLSPAKSSDTTDGSGTADVLYASTEVLGYPNITIYFENVDAGDDTVATSVDVSPDASTWITLSGSDCGALTPGDACAIAVSGSSYRYVRATVTDDGANAVDMEIWLTGNLN